MFLSTAAKQEGRQLSLSKENWLQELYLYEKSMDRRSRQIEVYLLRDPKTAQDLWKISLAFIHRYADYFWLKDMSADIVSDNSPKTEEKESHDSNRKEWILAAQYSPLSSGPYQLLGGFFYNRIAWKDDQSLHKGELKLQTALILQMAEAAKLLLNITWDIDEIYRERQQRFRPWGGGNIQIQAGF